MDKDKTERSQKISFLSTPWLIFYGLLSIAFLVAFLNIGYFGFKEPWDKIANGFAEGILGAAVISIITMLLLSMQTKVQKKHEIEKETSVEIFKSKIIPFANFTNSLWTAWEDKKIEFEELVKIKNHFFKEVYLLIETPKNLEKISECFSSLFTITRLGEKVSNEQNNQDKLREDVMEIINSLKKELKLYSEIAITKVKALDEFERIDDISDADIKNQILIQEEQPKGQITYWHIILFDNQEHYKFLKENKMVIVGDGDEKGNRVKLLSQININDILFIYSRGNGYIAACRAIKTAESIPLNDNRRKLMPLSVGLEGQLAIEPIKQVLSFDNIVERDKPRLSTIQRISNPADIDNLKKLFKEKGILI